MLIRSPKEETERQELSVCIHHSRR